ncbi:MAG: DNA polymerase III subunit beta, partial [Paludibacteraceae bacterium]|nr:DNA polymerase III subunit beta [Paludibacteraceae bacterium]
MKFGVSSSHLYERLTSVSRVINSKNSLPILNYFLFSIEGDTLSITASDTETTLITSMDLDEVEGEGKVAILAKNLLDILREFADQPITITIDTESFSIVITSAQGKFSFIGQSAN